MNRQVRAVGYRMNWDNTITITFDRTPPQGRPTISQHTLNRMGGANGYRQSVGDLIAACISIGGEFSPSQTGWYWERN